MATSIRKSGRQSKQEIVVFSLVGKSTCDECGATLGNRDFLTKRDDKGFCIECADLGDLWFLPRGDAALTRRAGKYSRARVIVVRYARARKHYERPQRGGLHPHRPRTAGWLCETTSTLPCRTLPRPRGIQSERTRAHDHRGS